MEALLLVGSFIFLLFFRVPVGFSLGIIALISLSLLRFSPNVLVHRMVGSMDSFPLAAIPLFILTALLMSKAKITDDIFDFAKSLVGHIRGSLGHVNVVASMIFAGISGSAIADSAGLGRIEIEAMRQSGYDIDFSAAVTVASSTIGPIIPPSIFMVLYGALTDTSVGKLFMGGIIPGIIMGLMMMVLIYVIAILRKFERSRDKFDLNMIFRSLKKSFLPLLTPIILVGGIISGIFTPTEAAAVASAYAFILGALIYRRLRIRDLPGILLEVGISTGIILFIYANATAYAWVMAIEKLPQLMLAFITGVSSNPNVVMALLLAVLLIVGCFLDPAPALLILMPVMLPIIVTFNIDPIHFGVVMAIALMIGLITPPVGMCLFVVCDITKLDMWRLTKAVMPFYLPLVFSNCLVAFWGRLVMFLPNLMK